MGSLYVPRMPNRRSDGGRASRRCLVVALAALAAFAALAAATAAVRADPKVVFPLVEGTRFTFKGARRDGSAHVWTTTLTRTDRAKGLYQYVPHESIANWFTKGGFRVDAAGIHVAGESLDGP